MTIQQLLNAYNDTTISKYTRIQMVESYMDTMSDVKELRALIKDPKNVHKSQMLEDLNGVRTINKMNADYPIDEMVRSIESFNFYFRQDCKNLEAFIIHINNNLDDVRDTTVEQATTRLYDYPFTELKKIDKILRLISKKFYSEDETYLHKQILEFYQNRFTKDQIVNGVLRTRGTWKELSSKIGKDTFINGHIDMNEFYNKFISIQSIRNDKLSKILE